MSWMGAELVLRVDPLASLGQALQMYDALASHRKEFALVQNSPFARKIASYVSLGTEELQAVSDLYRRRRKFAQGVDLVHQGEIDQSAFIMADGWACSYKILTDGARQIVNFQIPGDFLGVRSVLFRTSDNLASAYGIAVTGTFICTAVLAAVVYRRQFGWGRGVTILVFGTLFVIDVTFFAANTLKIVEGGWVPLVIGVALVAMMTSWKRGRALLLSRWRQDSMPIAPFLARLPGSRSILRVSGLAVFLTGNQDFVPTALLHNLKHNKVLHEQVMFVTIQVDDRPEVPADQRAKVEELSPGIHRVILRYGFMEVPNIPRALEELGPEAGFDAMRTSYFLGRDVLVPGMTPDLSWWRRWMFLWLARNAVPATEFFRIPSDRVVELGVRIPI